MMKDTMNYLEERQANDRSFTYELIIVDDGSPDKTSAVRSMKFESIFFLNLILKIALEYSAQYGTDIVRVLTFDANRGKGGAVRMVR
jgi:dolichyl-phosphate beta-glucosyltransferase